jgi:FkbM family methyltransferase
LNNAVYLKFIFGAELFGMTMKMKIRAALHSRGINVSRSAPNIVDFIKSRQIDMVYDVGANIGQYGRMLRAYGYDGAITSFEPVDGPFTVLKKVAEADGAWTACNFALGKEAGTASINVSQNTVFSSILPMTAAAGSFDKTSAVTHRQDITVKTFDSIHGGVSNRAFLKIDTQGFERNVLEGAAGSLDGILGVQMELPILHLYDGTWDLITAIQFMAGRGFSVSLMEPVNYLPDDPCSLVEVDCIFRRGRS